MSDACVAGRPKVTKYSAQPIDMYTTMDLSQALISAHSRSNRDRIVAYVNNDPVKFAVLFHCFKSKEAKISQRAAWSLSYCVEKFPELVIPYFGEMVELLKKEGIHDGIKRNILRTFQYTEIPYEQEGELLELCFAYLIDRKEAVAIRVFAMQVLANLAKKYPEIKNELNVLIEDELPYAKPAFVSRGRKILAG